jgi:hypothetical protein
MPNTILIAQPCHKNWDTMLPNAAGKFCTSCQKTVIDFTNLSQQEILTILQNSKTMPCGLFKASNVQSFKEPSPIKSNNRNLLAKYAAASLLLFNLSMPAAIAQGAPMLMHRDSLTKKTDSTSIKKTKKNSNPKPLPIKNEAPKINNSFVVDFMEQPKNKNFIKRLFKVSSSI